MKNEKRYIHVYTGLGKGKTTASVGLGFRAAGHGWKVLMIQFMKDASESGEVKIASSIAGFEILQFGMPEFVDKEHLS